MKKFILTLAAAVTLVTGAFATTTASAQEYRRHGGGSGWHDGGHRGGGGYYRGGGRGYRDDYRGGRGYRDYGRRHRGYDNDLGVGLLGLGVGAIIGSAIASQPSYPTYGQRYYDNPIVLEGPVYQQRPVYVRPAYREVYQRPAARGYNHIAACAARYRTYDSRTDTYIGRGMKAYRCKL